MALKRKAHWAALPAVVIPNRKRVCNRNGESVM